MRSGDGKTAKSTGPHALANASPRHKAKDELLQTGGIENPTVPIRAWLWRRRTLPHEQPASLKNITRAQCNELLEVELTPSIRQVGRLIVFIGGRG